MSCLEQKECGEQVGKEVVPKEQEETHSAKTVTCSLINDHLLKELGTIIVSYTELEKYEYGDEKLKLNVHFTCLFGEFHGEISIYATGFHPGMCYHHNHVHSKIIKIYNGQKKPTQENKYRAAVYRFDKGVACGQQVHFNSDGQINVSHMLLNKRLNGTSLIDGWYNKCTSIYKDGIKHGLEMYIEKRLNAPYTLFDCRTGDYDRGCREGEWTETENDITYTVTYSNDVEMKRVKIRDV